MGEGGGEGVEHSLEFLPREGWGVSCVYHNREKSSLYLFTDLVFEIHIHFKT